LIRTYLTGLILLCCSHEANSCIRTMFVHWNEVLVPLTKSRRVDSFGYSEMLRNVSHNIDSASNMLGATWKDWLPFHHKITQNNISLKTHLFLNLTHIFLWKMIVNAAELWQILFYFIIESYRLSWLTYWFSIPLRIREVLRPPPVKRSFTVFLSPTSDGMLL
jgi:hypothetical protein